MYFNHFAFEDYYGRRKSDFSLKKQLITDLNQVSQMDNKLNYHYIPSFKLYTYVYKIIKRILERLFY